MIRASCPLALLFLVGGCVTPSEAPPASEPVLARPVALPPAPLAADWQDWPLAPGDWTRGRADGDTNAVFSSPCGGTRTRLVWFTCLAATGQVAITGVGGSGALTVRTSSATRSLPSEPLGEALGRSLLPAADPLLDAIAFSRGRFVLQRAGTAPLVLPAHAEIGRVIEDCRGR